MRTVIIRGLWKGRGLASWDCDAAEDEVRTKADLVRAETSLLVEDKAGRLGPACPSTEEWFWGKEGGK